ncbi:MAG: HD domain-containing phosphohydrolase [Pseudomonadota bacterium]
MVGKHSAVELGAFSDRGRYSTSRYNFGPGKYSIALSLCFGILTIPKNDTFSTVAHIHLREMTGSINNLNLNTYGHMTTYVPIRKSQIFHYLKTPLYIKNDKGDYILYKSENTKIDSKRFIEDAYPQLYTPEEMSSGAFEELRYQLKNKLVKKIEAGDLRSIKSTLNEIVQESFEEPIEENIQHLPETIELIYNEYSSASKLLKTIVGIQYGGTTLSEHSINVMLLVLNYCVFTNQSEKDTKALSLGALLHDVGLAIIPKKLIESKRKLTDSEFTEYKSHPAIGHDMIKENFNTDDSLSVGALEHHERLDGSGYPRGISNIAFEGRLIGMIDCFDSLTNSKKIYRRKKDPFSALKLIQDEMLHMGKFDKVIFKDLCLSLFGKTKYSDAY